MNNKAKKAGCGAKEADKGRDGNPNSGGNNIRSGSGERREDVDQEKLRTSRPRAGIRAKRGGRDSTTCRLRAKHE